MFKEHCLFITQHLKRFLFDFPIDGRSTVLCEVFVGELEALGLVERRAAHRRRMRIFDDQIVGAIEQ